MPKGLNANKAKMLNGYVPKRRRQQQNVLSCLNTPVAIDKF